MDIQATGPEKRQGQPLSGTLEDPEKKRQTGRQVPDVWQEDVTEESMPSPQKREDAAHFLTLDPS
jgi:hypothetical protein